MEVEELYSIYQQSGKVCTDSRKVEENDLFFALKGEQFDGNKFAKKAIDSGCSYAVIDNEDYQSEKTILVQDVLQSLQELATLHIRKLKIPVLAITGTNGKTTTKELVRDVLCQKYKTGATAGNLNNHIGVPLTILEFDETIELAIIEMGANHEKEIGRLCHIAQPNYGIITNVGKAHLEGFGSFEGVKRAKGELYGYLIDHKGTIIFNSDNVHLKEMLHQPYKKVFTYGTESAMVTGKITSENTNFLSTQISVKDGSDLNVSTQLVGDYNHENVMAAVTVGVVFNVGTNEIKKAIEEYVPSNNRSQLLKTDQNELILDCYNANPTSMGLAVKNLLKSGGQNKVFILGDMLELGENSTEEHSKIIGLFSEVPNALLYTVGPEFAAAASPRVSQSFCNVLQLIEYLKKESIISSKVLIKGSRGIQLEKIVEFL